MNESLILKVQGEAMERSVNASRIGLTSVFRDNEEVTESEDWVSPGLRYCCEP